MDQLFTPWRYEYLMSDKSGVECIFCVAAKAADDRECHVVYRGRTHFVLLNRYPYTSGHLMVAPYGHLRRLSQSNPADLHELVSLAARCERALERTYRPEGINVGMNLGRASGAGFAEHYHLHLVPRWGGDTSFITVTGGARIIPEELDQTWERLRRALEQDRAAGEGE